MKPKFQIGDIVRVVSVPVNGNKKYIGYEFEIIDLYEDGESIKYWYVDSMTTFPQRFLFPEQYLELAEICKSPLWQALR